MGCNFRNLMLQFMKITAESTRISNRVRARRTRGVAKAAITPRISYWFVLRAKFHVEPRGRERASQLAVVRVANNWEPRVAA